MRPDLCVPSERHSSFSILRAARVPLRDASPEEREEFAGLGLEGGVRGQDLQQSRWRQQWLARSFGGALSRQPAAQRRGRLRCWRRWPLFHHILPVSSDLVVALLHPLLPLAGVSYGLLGSS